MRVFCEIGGCQPNLFGRQQPEKKDVPAEFLLIRITQIYAESLTRYRSILRVIGVLYILTMRLQYSSNTSVVLREVNSDNGNCISTIVSAAHSIFSTIIEVKRFFSPDPLLFAFRTASSS